MNVVWRREWAKEDETPWSLFEKLTCANCVERNEVIRTLGSMIVKNIKNQMIGDNKRELFELSGFEPELLSKIFDFNLHERNKLNIDSLVGPLEYYRMPRHRWFSMQLRWCPECLETGFHSWYHQFSLMNVCPYHGSGLFETCPYCKKQIPFLLSDKGLGSPFSCKCGYSLSDAYRSRWAKWNTIFNVKSPSLNLWVSKGKAKARRGERWLFLPKHCDIELLTTAQPRLQSKKYSVPFLLEKDGLRSADFRTKYYNENKITFLAIEQHIHKKILKGHKHCIQQLLDLRKEEGSDFNKPCPYAYAYVFWRKSILMLDHFYRRNRDDIEPPGAHGLNTATKLINDELKFILDEYIRQTSTIGTNVKAVFWILNKITAQFSINFFFEWLRISGEGAYKESTPRWSEIETMKDACFPRFAFRYDISSNERPLEYYLSKFECCNLPKYNCPNSKALSKKRIQRMQSFTPLTVAMRVYDKPSEENKELKRYVDRYIQNFSF